MPDELNHNLLRAYADGELSAEESRRVEAVLARDPKWQLALEAEHRLCKCVDQVMGRVSVVAPVELRNRITAEFERESAVDASVPTQTAPAQPQTSNRAAEPTNTGWLAALAARFNRPHRVSFSAIAAVVVLVSMVVLYGIFGLPIDHRAETPLQPSILLSEAAAHVSQEHDRCAGDDSVLMNKLVAMTRADAVHRLQSHLGVDSVTVFDLSALGYQFVGVGPCNMPGTAPSAHLVYRRSVPGEPKSMMSIFVTPNLGQFGEKCPNLAKKEGRWSGICGGKACRKTILHGTDDQLVYFLACGFAEQVRQVSESVCRDLARRGR